MKLKEIQNKIQEEMKQGNFKVIVAVYDNEAWLSFKSDVLNMLDVQVLMAFNVSTEEHFNVCSYNGMSFKEDLSEVKVEGFDFVLEYNGTEHEIDLSEYKETFSEIIAEYYTPHQC